jgi:hypothetical protein
MLFELKVNDGFFIVSAIDEENVYSLIQSTWERFDLRENYFRTRVHCGCRQIRQEYEARERMLVITDSAIYVLDVKDCKAEHLLT